MATKLSKAAAGAIKREAKARAAAKGGSAPAKQAAQRFIRFGGSTRNYLDTKTGYALSNREYRELGLGKVRASAPKPLKTLSAKARNTGEVRAYEADRKNKQIRQGKARRTSLDLYIERQRQLGHEITRKEALSSDQYKALNEQRHARFKNGKPNLRAQRRALIDLGKREGIPDWVKVGDSAKFRKASNEGSAAVAAFETAYKARNGGRGY